VHNKKHQANNWQLIMFMGVKIRGLLRDDYRSHEDTGAAKRHLRPAMLRLLLLLLPQNVCLLGV
jgi:hypothetical protein